MSLLRPDDYFITSYRDHGYALARGTDPRPLMAELFGRATGISRGKGGSMHFYDVPTGNFGGDGIVGGHLPVAAGMGYAIRLRQTDQAVLCFFGDGAVNEGAFHEALNVSALWGLPVVYVIENNRYGMGTSLDRASSVKDLYQRGSAYGIPRRDVDGMDLLSVRRALAEAIDRARREKRPTLVEVETYRYRGHSMSDPGKYRTKEEVEEMMRHDPIVRFTGVLAEQHRVGQAELDAIDKDVIAQVERGRELRRGEPVAHRRRALPGRLRALALHPRQDGGQGPGLARVAEGGPAARALPGVGAGARAGQGGGLSVPVMTMRDALNAAMKEEMRRDPSVFLLGEEVAEYQGAYKITQGMFQEFGEWRVRDTPIAEEAIAGVAVGAAFVGMRPIAEMMTFNFALLALDQIVNHAAKYRYMSGGQIRCPMVMRGPSGAAAQVAAQHSQAFESWFVHIPGLVVVMPSTPRDAKGLLKSAIRDDNPVIFMENEVLYNLKGEVPEEEYTIPLGLGEVKRAGKDVTIVAWSRSVQYALQAAELLAKDGIQAEVVDPRTLRPLDEDVIFDSVRKTNRCVVVEEGWRYAGFGAEIADRVQRSCFDDLDAPVIRVTAADVPMPYSKILEKAFLPQPERVAEAARQVLYR